MLEFSSRPTEKKSLEEGLLFTPKFDQDGLIPVVTCDYQTNDILMVAFMNVEALRMTLDIGEAVYYSRSRQEIWHKGATSGNVQKVHQILTDCDQDCISLKVEMLGDAQASCHTGRTSCFYREVPFGDKGKDLAELKIIDHELHFDPEKVYGKK